MTYKIIEDTSILRLSDNAVIPVDPSNSDYIAYQEWSDAGNQPIQVNPYDRNLEIKRGIESLESNITIRRIREAILGIDDGWLALVDSKIEYLRSQLEE